LGNFEFNLSDARGEDNGSDPGWTSRTRCWLDCCSNSFREGRSDWHQYPAESRNLAVGYAAILTVMAGITWGMLAKMILGIPILSGVIAGIVLGIF